MTLYLENLKPRNILHVSWHKHTSCNLNGISPVSRKFVSQHGLSGEDILLKIESFEYDSILSNMSNLTSQTGIGGLHRGFVVLHWFLMPLLYYCSAINVACSVIPLFQ